MSEAVLAWTSDRGPESLRSKLYREDKGRCHYCQKNVAVEDFTIDHIVPRAFGGINARSNYVVSCKQCNVRWGAAVRKCACDKCERALQAHLEALASGGRQELRTDVASRVAQLTELLADNEERLEQFKAKGYHIWYDPEAAALAGKCKGLRMGLRFLQDLT